MTEKQMLDVLRAYEHDSHLLLLLPAKWGSRARLSAIYSTTPKPGNCIDAVSDSMSSVAAGIVRATAPHNV